MTLLSVVGPCVGPTVPKRGEKLDFQAPIGALVDQQTNFKGALLLSKMAFLFRCRPFLRQNALNVRCRPFSNGYLFYLNATFKEKTVLHFKNIEKKSITFHLNR